MAVNESYKEEFKDLYVRIGFISDILIESLDQLEKFGFYKHQLKHYVKQTLSELEKISNEFYEKFNIKEKTSDGIQMIDIYNNVSKAYENGIDFFTKQSPEDILIMMEVIKRALESGLDLKQISVSYKPAEI